MAAAATATATETPLRQSAQDTDHQPWWTPADQAELSLLIHELVDAADSHRARAPECCHGDLERCYPFAQVIGQVLDWRHHRAMVSYAGWARALQDWRDAA